ncbi:hypothetical protein MetMK1DRAFT_00006100 [Metallosphaera yellowstonensis MK1]|uniref:Uncharacterized protein n=1 Tax=Metallosphaera yellowstonensis MK1 TaxID=671065 RepID=H2C784_9CREN|nr:hypothetical protein [Metallosphaera yellowstonensis]EHP68010.1 hypothetical protein MetMK1DRAFT_00024330 [Metallosphaera yellowstonensis MK1]EHP70108.1 hypothetical protein MetMK1DRAFT_00006100 [Metallosphaera yellowstonensis MK1]
MREELVRESSRSFRGVKDVLKGLIEDTLQEVMRVEGTNSSGRGGRGE